MRKIKMTPQTHLHFFQNAAALSASALLIRSIGLLSGIYITAKIGAEGIGLNTLIGSVYGFALTLATSGVNLAAVRLCSERGGRDCAGVFKVCLKYALIFSLTTAALLLSFAGFIGTSILHDSRTVMPLRILAFALPAVAVASMLNGIFVGSGKGYKNAAVQIIEHCSKLALTVAALTFVSGSIEKMCAAAICATAAGEYIQLAVTLAIYFRSRPSPDCKQSSLNLPPPKLRDAAAISLPVAVGAYARSALLTVEHLAIPWGLRMSENPETALASYGALHGMALPVVLFPMAVSGAVSVLLVPEVAASRVKGDCARIGRIAEKALTTVFLYALTAACVIFIFADTFGVLLYNSSEAGLYMRMLAPLVPVMYLDGATDAILKGLNLQVYSMGVNIVDSSLSVALVLLLVPRMGIMGYMVTVYAAETLNMSLSVGRLYYELKIKPKKAARIATKSTARKNRVPEAVRLP